MKSYQALAVILSFVIFIAVGFLVYKSYGKTSLVSPVLGISKDRLADNIWFPLESDFTNEEFKLAPEVTSRAAFFIETNSGKVLYEKNAHEKFHIASLMKIMTTIVALEGKTMDDTFDVSSRASDMEPDKMFLIAGERMTLRELLQGIFLISANDAAEVIAEGTTGRREEFINLMNSKAAQLGMNNTFFANPTGLEEDNITQFSTSYDTALMSRYLIKKWPEIVGITSNPHIFIDRTDNHQDYDMYSGINLLTTYPGVIGLKTGYTPEAGLTLVTLARIGNNEVLGVLLGAVNRRDDAKALLDYSFKKLGF